MLENDFDSAGFSKPMCHLRHMGLEKVPDLEGVAPEGSSGQQAFVKSMAENGYEAWAHCR